MSAHHTLAALAFLPARTVVSAFQGIVLGPRSGLTRNITRAFGRLGAFTLAIAIITCACPNYYALSPGKSGGFTPLRVPLLDVRSGSTPYMGAFIRCNASESRKRLSRLRANLASALPELGRYWPSFASDASMNPRDSDARSRSEPSPPTIRACLFPRESRVSPHPAATRARRWPCAHG